MEYSYGALTKIQFLIVLLLSSAAFCLMGKRSNFSFKKLLKEKNVMNFITLLYLVITVFSLIYLYAFRSIGTTWEKIGGYDAGAYKEYFLGKLTNTHYEFGYSLLNRFIRLFTNNYQVFLIIISIFMIFCIIKFLREVNNYNYLLVTMLLIMFFESFNTQRNSLCIFIFLLITISINKEKYGQAVLLALISMSIHTSSLIIFPVIIVNYLLSKKKDIPFAKLVMLILLMCTITIVLSQMMKTFLASTVYETYVNGTGDHSLKIYLFALGVLILSHIKQKKLVKQNRINKTLILSIPIIFLVIPMQLMAVIFYRMCLFFLPLMYTMLAELFKSDKKIPIRILIISLFLYKIIDFFSTIYYIGIIH